MTDDQQHTPVWATNPEIAGALSDQLGRFILEFSELEATLSYDIGQLFVGSSNAGDEGFIINDVLMFGSKVSLFDGLCRMKGYEEVDDWRDIPPYKLKDVVTLLREAGASRNRFVHDEMWASSSFGSAKIVQLSKKGNPWGENDDGWLGNVDPETIQTARDQITKAKDALVTFMIALNTKRQADSNP
jgi:hypothetical protein